MSTRKLFLILTLVSSSFLFSGCATEIGSNSYDDEDVGAIANSYKAVVIKVRNVNVGPDKLEKSGAGTLAGGVAGAAIGSEFGSGIGNVLMTTGGALAGAVGGAYAEKSLKKQVGLEITVQLTNGELKTVVQGNDTSFSKGESVMLLAYAQGRSKVVKID
jgi:outer membrane lipoprotein SlyB